MFKRYKSTKGITLVALVITIIILLILAGISISTLTNTGIFGKAKDAKEKSEVAEKQQSETLDSYEKELNKYTSDNLEENIGVKFEKNTELHDKNGAKIIVPAGFKVVNTDDLTVEKGIVVEDNRKLKFTNFIKSFFIGLVAILALIVAVTLLFVVGAPLYACAILFIGLALIMLGKFAFIISAGLRIVNKSDKSSKGKDILTAVLVVLALDIIGILSFAGGFGTAIVSIVNTLVCLSGFGTIFEVLFAKKNKEKKIESKKEITKKEAVKKEENKVESNKKTEEIDDSKKADEKQEIANKADVESKNLDANKVETEEGTTAKNEEDNKE